MIGLVLVTHGRLAEELRSAMEHVVGAQRNVCHRLHRTQRRHQGRRAEIHRCINAVDTGDGVVLLTDMFGGTPTNLAISQMDRKGVEVICRRQPANAGEARESALQPAARRRGRLRRRRPGANTSPPPRTSCRTAGCPTRSTAPTTAPAVAPINGQKLSRAAG